MSQEQIASPNMNRWEAQSLRITNFILAGASIEEPESWWMRIVDHEPEEVLSRPGMGQLQQTGEVEGNKLALVVQPGRVDLQLLPALEDEQPLGILTMGSFDKATDSFIDLGQNWLKVCPPTTRLAFGAVLLSPVPSRESGYSEISPFLHNAKIPKNATDFLYQINLPRQSKSDVSDLKINRLTKWSVMLSGTTRLAISRGAVLQTEDGPQEFAARLEMDLNTAADFPGEIPKDNIIGVFKELVELGKEIALEGDVP